MLTKDAQNMLYTIYKEYCSRRNVGSSKLDAKKFKTGESIRENFFPDMSLADVEETLRELDRDGYFKICYTNNRVSASQLSDDAISKMENLPMETFLSFADFIAKFIH